MTEPSLELQKAIRSRLVSASALIGLVPAKSIIDSSGRPQVFPSILIGEGQTVPDAGLSRRRHEVYTDLHIWTTETGLETSKRVAGEIRAALTDANWTVTGLQVADLYISSVRFIRDPDGIHSHAVMSLHAAVLEVA